MSTLSLQECIDAVKKEYPKHYPYAFVEFDGVYIFSIIPKGVPANKAISDMHIVDPKSGNVSGGISVMELLKDPKFREVWKKPNLVSNHDEALHHSSFFNLSPNTRYWGIKKTVNYSTSDYLEHHGIRGQKWGVQNGPPYPLDKKSHDKVVSGENQNRSTNKRTGLLLELAVFNLMKHVVIPIYMRKNMKKYEEEEQNKVDIRNRDLSRDLISDIADVEKRFSKENMPKTINGEHSVESDMAAVNPHYKGGVVPGTSVNCALCTVAYDMRRRGYDVTSLASDSGTYVELMLSRIYNGVKEDKVSARNWTDFYEQAAKKYPEGSRGEIHVSAPSLGHSMSWEIRDGKFEVLDTQRNVKVQPRDLAEYGYDVLSKDNGLYRLDNLDIKPENLHYACAELKSDWKKTMAKLNRASKPKTSGMNISESERRRNYEELWKKEHPNASNSQESRESMENWVNAQINR